ncbi:MAG: cyclic nucleotide-binding domain-containing protein, partial [Candidatus Margulisiibacteriota bacterium]
MLAKTISLPSLSTWEKITEEDQACLTGLNCIFETLNGDNGGFVRGLMASCEVASLNAETELIKQGDLEAKFCFVIISGEVLVKVCSGTTHTDLARIVGGTADSIVGERALLLNEPRNASVVISQDNTRIIRIPKKAFLESESSEQQIRIQLQELLGNRDRILFENVAIGKDRMACLQGIMDKGRTDRFKNIGIEKIIEEEIRALYMAYSRHSDRMFQNHLDRFGEFFLKIVTLLPLDNDRVFDENARSLMKLKEITPYPQQPTWRDPAQPETIVDLLSRGWTTAKITQSINRIGEFLTAIQFKVDSFPIFISPKAEFTHRFHQFSQLTIPGDKTPDEFEFTLEGWLATEIAKRFFINILSQYNNSLGELFETPGNVTLSEHHPAILEIKKKQILDKLDPRVCAQMLWMKLGLAILSKSLVAKGIDLAEQQGVIKKYFEHFLRQFNNGYDHIAHDADNIPSKGAGLQAILEQCVAWEVKCLFSPGLRIASNVRKQEPCIQSCEDFVVHQEGVAGNMVNFLGRV